MGTPHWGGSWYPSLIGSGPESPFLPFMFFWDISTEEARTVFAAFNASLADVECEFGYVVAPAPSMTVNGKDVVRIYPNFAYGQVDPTGRPGQFIQDNYTRFSSYQYFAAYFSSFVPMTEFAEPGTLAAKLWSMKSKSFFYLSTGKALGGNVSSTGQGTAINPHTFQSGSLLIASYAFQGYWPGRQPTREALKLVLEHMQFQGVLKQFEDDSITYPSWCLAVKTLDDSAVERCWHEVDVFVERIAELFRNQVWPSFRSQFPNAGSYASEGDYFEPDWQHQFWGDNYEHLYRIKQKYDPRGLFVCRHCVGSEDWVEESGNCFKPANPKCPLTRAARQYWR